VFHDVEVVLDVLKVVVVDFVVLNVVVVLLVVFQLVEVDLDVDWDVAHCVL